MSSGGCGVSQALEFPVQKRSVLGWAPAPQILLERVHVTLCGNGESVDVTAGS